MTEYKLYKILQEQLPENWTVFYNLHFELTNGFGRKEFRQLDFLVVAPDCGVYNLECKGHYNWNGTEFYHGSDPNNTVDLIGQCKTAVRDIVTFLRQHRDAIIGLDGDGGRLPINVGGTLAFPCYEFEYDDLSTASNRVSGEVAEFGTGLPVLDALAMHDGGVERFIRERSANTYGLTAPIADGIVELLTQSATAKLKDGEQNKLPVQVLTKQMDGLIRSREELLPLIVHSPRQYLYVTGGAGPGKTWLAKSYARQYAAAFPDHKILMVCFNKLLAAALRLDSELMAIPNINIASFHRLYLEGRKDLGFTGQNMVVFKAGCKPQYEASGQDDGYVFQDCIDTRSLPRSGYDCIIVDEAQDFTEGRFAFLMSLLKERNQSRMFICSGNEQNIYGGNAMVKGVWFGPNIWFDASNSLHLKSNLRNSVRIHKYCRRFSGDKITESGVAYKGQDCIIETSNRPLGKIIESLKDKDGLENRNIAVLTDKTDLSLPDTETWIRYQSQKSIPDASGSTKLVATTLDETAEQLTAWRNNQGIWVSTLHAFKGLEADCVIVYLKNPNTRADAIYVACTRAKFKLIIVPNDTRLRVDKPERLVVKAT